MELNANMHTLTNSLTATFKNITSVVALATALTLTACGGSGGTTSVKTPEPEPIVVNPATSYTLKLVPSTTALGTKGGTATITASITNAIGGNVAGKSITIGLNKQAQDANVRIIGASTITTDDNGNAVFSVDFTPLAGADLTDLKTSGIVIGAVVSDGSATGKTTSIAIQDNSATIVNTLSIVTNKTSLSSKGGTATITTSVTDVNGGNVAGKDITIGLNQEAKNANVRIVGASTITTDSNGNATFSISFTPLAGADLTALKVSGIVISAVVSDGSATAKTTSIAVQDNSATIVNTLSIVTNKTSLSSKGGTATITTSVTDVNGGNVAGKDITIGLNQEAKNANVRIVGASTITTDSNGNATFSISFTPLAGADLNALKTSGIIIAATVSDGSATGKFTSIAVQDDSLIVNTLAIRSDKTSLSSKGGTATITASLINATGGNVAGVLVTLGLNNEAKAAGVRFTGTGAQSATTDANGDATFSISFLPTAGTDLTALKASGIVIAAVVEDNSATNQNVIISIQDQPTADYAITAYQSKIELLTGGDTSDLTFRVTDVKGGILAGVPISLAIDNPLVVGASLESASTVTTDATGVVKTKITLANNKLDYRINHPIKVTASVNDDTGAPLASQVVNFNVTGTTIVLQSDKSVIETGGNVVVTETVKDATGQPLQNAATDLFNSAGNVIASSTTNSLGVATFVVTFANLTPNAAGQVILHTRVYGTSASVYQDSDELTLTSNATNFSFSSLPTTDTAIGTSATIKVKVKGATAADVNGKIVALSSTLGTVTPSTQTASGAVQNGSVWESELTFTVNSTTPGSAQLKATLNGGGDISSSINFIAVTPAKMSLQTVYSTLAVNASTRIYAIVKDANDAPVKGVTVSFNRAIDSSGGSISSASAVTDENGSTFVTYTAGGSTTSNNGVRIDASVVNTPTISKQTFLTIIGQAAYITMGYADKLSTDPANVYYLQAHSITVVDNAGRPMANQPVSVSLTTGNFIKGQYSVATSTDSNGNISYLWARSAFTCAPEDGSVDGIRNNLLDAGEDINGNGILDARNSNTLLGGTQNADGSYTFITDATGKFDFQLRYFKTSAEWLMVNLLATTNVQGTESSVKITHGLPVLDVDITSPSATSGGMRPNINSPYGYIGSCSSPY